MSLHLLVHGSTEEEIRQNALEALEQALDGTFFERVALHSANCLLGGCWEYEYIEDDTMADYNERITSERLGWQKCAECGAGRE